MFILTETLLSPAEAARRAPGQPHVSTIWRWMTRGNRGVVLESVVCAGRRYTSLEAITRFVAATTAAAAQVGSAIQDSATPVR